jgi:hypothetical protein
LSQNEFEISLILSFLLLTLWFILAALRLRKSIKMREVFVSNYEVICEDDSVPMHLLESLSIVFKMACGYCVCARLLELFFFKPLRPDAKLKLELRSMEPLEMLNLAATLRSFMLYISYGASIMGTISRWIFINRQYRLPATNDDVSTVELAELTELLAKAKFRWR